MQAPISIVVSTRRSGRPSGVCKRKLAAAAICVVLGGAASCASTDHVYKMYGGPARPEVELAIINLNNATVATIGERKVTRSDYSRVQVLPGTARVHWLCVSGASVTVEPSGFVTSAASDDVELQAGHIYSLHCARTYGRGYRTYQWIVDDTAGVIVAGEQKP